MASPIANSSWIRCNLFKKIIVFEAVVDVDTASSLRDAKAHFSCFVA